MFQNIKQHSVVIDQQKAFAFKGRPEDVFCIKVSSYQYKGFHNKDNTVRWQSYSYSGIYLSGTNIYIEMDPLRISEIHRTTDASCDLLIIIIGILTHGITVFTSKRGPVYLVQEYVDAFIQFL